MKFGKKLLFLSLLGIIPAIQAMEQELAPTQQEKTEASVVNARPLSDEIWIHIFSFLRFKDIPALNKTCKYFYKLSAIVPENAFWLSPLVQGPIKRAQEELESSQEMLMLLQTDSYSGPPSEMSTKLSSGQERCIALAKEIVSDCEKRKAPLSKFIKKLQKPEGQT